MLSDSLSKYDQACDYAISALGAETASQYFPRLKKFSRFAPLEDLYALIESWQQPIPKITLPEPPPPEPWSPCKRWHFGGDKSCDYCTLKDKKAGLIYAGANAIAQKLFEAPVSEGGCRPFVRQRIHAELLPYGGRPYSFDDIEQKVWASIAASIAGYRDAETPLAWLRPLVHGVVIKHFRDQWRQMRDFRKEEQFDIETHDSANPDSPVSVPAQSTAVVNEK
jgi:Sigma-70 region 2